MDVRLIEWQQVTFRDEKERKKDATPLIGRNSRRGERKGLFFF